MSYLQYCVSHIAISFICYTYFHNVLEYIYSTYLKFIKIVICVLILVGDFIMQSKDWVKYMISYNTNMNRNFYSQVDDNWWIGNCHGRRGLLPANYVELDSYVYR